MAADLDVRAILDAKDRLQPGWVRCLAINWSTGQHHVTDAQAANLKVDAQMFIDALKKDRVVGEKAQRMLAHMIADALDNVADEATGAQITALMAALQILDPRIVGQMGSSEITYMAVILNGSRLEFSGADDEAQFRDTLALLVERTKQGALQ